MMSLVAYGSSDDDSEAEDEVQASKREPNGLTKADVQVKEKYSNDSSKTVKNGSPEEETKEGSQASSDSSISEQKASFSSNVLFSKLPEPSSMTDFISGSSIVSRKKSQLKGPIKILVPSLPEFDEEDEPPPKKKAQVQVHKSTTGTKLMSMLPAPRGGTFTKESKPSLVPQSITRRPAPPPKLKPPIKKLTPAPPAKPTGLTTYDDSDDDEAPTDFFSLTTDHSVPAAVATSDLNFGIEQQSVYQQPATSSTDHKQPGSYPGYADVAESSSCYAEPQAESGQDYIGLGNDDLQLDEEAIQKLCGRKGKLEENVQIIDVSGDEIMPDSKEWLTKQLTQERPNRSHRKGFGPSSQQRRKHQITYLAFQAKENELELQNQWANNRQSRRQTQSKYGF